MSRTECTSAVPRTSGSPPRRLAVSPTPWLGLATALGIAVCAAGSGLAAAEPQVPSPLRWVAELEVPEGIVYQKRAERAKLAGREEEQAGLRALEATVRRLWPEIRARDLHALSRTQVEATRGFRLPEEPGELRGQAIGRGADGLWYLELLGPRLPARFDIVHRHLAVYGAYDPRTGELSRLTVTIRGWVYE